MMNFKQANTTQILKFNLSVLHKGPLMYPNAGLGIQTGELSEKKTKIKQFFEKKIKQGRKGFRPISSRWGFYGI